MLKAAGLVLATIVIFVSFASAEDGERLDVGLGYFGAFSKTSSASQTSVTDTPTTAGGASLAFRYHFNHTHGIELNIGHNSNSQVFSVPPDIFRVKTGITEYTGAYVLSPFHTRRIEPFVFAGGGVLLFNPGKQYIDGFVSPFGAKSQSALAIVYGGGADYRVWKKMALRVQYRGLIYKTPDFNLPSLFTGVYGHMAEPSAGIVIKF